MPLGTGTITPRDFRAVVSSASDDNSLALGPQQIDYISRALFEALDSDHDGVVSFGDLKARLEKSPHLIDGLQISWE